MNRGRPVLSWAEPDTWRKAVKAHAKKAGVSTLPWLTWLAVLALSGGLITWEWVDADPTRRVSVPTLLALILILFGFFLGLGWIYVRLNRTRKTTIYDRGLSHGSLTNKRWCPWSDVEYFYIGEDSLEQRTFRFLTWSRMGDDDEEFSVVPDDVDLDVAVKCFRNNNVEQVAAGQPATPPRVGD